MNNPGIRVAYLVGDEQSRYMVQSTMLLGNGVAGRMRLELHDAILYDKYMKNGANGVILAAYYWRGQG